MILRGIKDRNQNSNNAFSVGSIYEPLICIEGDGTTGQKGSRQVADGRYDYGKVVAPIPKTIVGCLITEDLDNFSLSSRFLLMYV